MNIYIVTIKPVRSQIATSIAFKEREKAVQYVLDAIEKADPAWKSFREVSKQHIDLKDHILAGDTVYQVQPSTLN